MGIVNRVKNAINALGASDIAKNDSSGQKLANDFLRYGNKNTPMYQDWSQVEMSDKDMYTGYSYAAINKRANRASVLGKNFLRTESAPALAEKAKEKQEELIHPYLDLVRGSKEFTERKFWNDISTYLDLEGVYYLMAVRAVANNKNGETKVGNIQKFVMLNPYQVRRVTKESDGTVGGYIESRNGRYREIPKEMIIEIRLLNPFNQDEAFSMTDAAKESQFTLKQAGDFTRHSIKGNINAPGAITTDVVLDDNVFDNFVSRIRNHSKGEPLYGNGAGAIKWESMQIDLDKASLDKINEIHRSMLFAVSGTSKTMMGIEESGTGREVSKTQKDDFTENAVMPQVEDIIDALNLDYRKHYPDYDKNKYEIVLDNPLESDREAEMKDMEIREKAIEVRQGLVNMGYEYEIAAKYATGDLGLAELGEPTLEPAISQDQAVDMVLDEMGMSRKELEDDEPNNLLTESTLKTRTENKFVTPEKNEEIIKEVRKKLKQKLADKRKAERQQKIAEKEAKKKELQDKAKKEKSKKKTTKKADTDKKQPERESEVEDKSERTVEVKVTIPENTVDERLKAINEIASKDYPELYKDMDIDMNNLGCIMLDTVPVPVVQYVKNGMEDVYDDGGSHTGLVGENEAHVTLLYGLLENGNVWKDKVDTVLEGWSVDTVKIEEVGYFELEDSYAVIGLVEKTKELVDGHERLTLLPHVNTFSEYHPHITLAYIKKDADVDKWLKALNKKYKGQKVATKGINYGDKPEKKKKDDNTLNKDAQQAILEPHRSAVPHDCNEHTLQPNNEINVVQNALQPNDKDSVILAEGSLQEGIANLEADVAVDIIEAMKTNDFETIEDLVTEPQQERHINALGALLALYYLQVMPIYGKQLMSARAEKFGKQGVYAMTNELEEYMDMSASKASESHINTILKDFDRALQKSLFNSTQTELITLVQARAQAQDSAVLAKLPDNFNREDVVKAVKKGVFDSEPIYELARQKAKEGKGLDAITREIRKEYQKISRNRAKTIARHETNRVFNMSQYQADLQFLHEADLIKNAYKILRNRADDPCPICAKVIADSRANPVPFEQNFVDLGETITATYTKENGKKAVTQQLDYEPITAGNVHVNCRCEYELIIEDGKVINMAECRKL